MNSTRGEFIDTNILVYAHDQDAGPRHVRAVDLITHLSRERRGAISIQVLIEFYAAGTRKLGISAQEVEDTIVGLQRWRLHAPNAADVLRAIALQRRYQVQWWDALILNSAIQLNCSVLWTEDLNDGQVYDGVTVRNPFLQGTGRPKTGWQQPKA
jgi:predicted nucleic acid-binding protein